MTTERGRPAGDGIPAVPKKPRRGTIIDRSRDEVYAVPSTEGAPSWRNKTDREVQGHTQIYTVAQQRQRQTRAKKIYKRKPRNREVTEGETGWLRRVERSLENFVADSGKQREGACTRIDRVLELVLRKPQTLMKGLEALKTETKRERVQGVGFKVQ
ncbi:hypothetical protein K438DRAFT_1771222 [Mycena galopus ATCC 62051]|nr:hypothetical protein K438DRAFT_1771222 [Mycena galopus ATCC 62051]